MLNDDDIIFHYTKASTALELILKDQELLLGYFGNTNDAYEYRSKGIGVILPNEDFETNVSIEIDKIIRNKIRFISFCRNDDSNNEKSGCSLPRMWSQYGDNNKGICLAFSRTKIENVLTKLNGVSPLFKSEPIHYTRNLMNLMLRIEDDSHAECDDAKLAIKYIKENYQKLLFYKDVDYRDEREYRIVAHSDDKDVKIDIRDALKMIIVGDNFNKAYYPVLKYYMNMYNVPVKKMIWNKHQFAPTDIKNNLNQDY